MQIIIILLIAVILVFVGFWLASAIIAGLAGAPSVYANEKIIIEAIKLAGLKQNETFLDLGCGDGRSLIIAHQKCHAKAIGVEKSPFCFLQSKLKTRQYKNITIRYGDIRNCQKLIAKADVIYLYLLPKMMPKIEDMIFNSIKANARVVSVSFVFKHHKPTRSTGLFNQGLKTVIRSYSK